MSLQKTKLTAGELFQIEAELNGAINQQTGEILQVGLLKQELPIKTKYWLSRLADNIAGVKKTIDKMRQELFEQFGTPSAGGNIMVPYQIEDPKGAKNEDGTPLLVDNPGLKKFNESMEELFSQEHEVEHARFCLDDFSFQSSANYSSFYKLIEEPAAAEAAA